MIAEYRFPSSETESKNGDMKFQPDTYFILMVMSFIKNEKNSFNRFAQFKIIHLFVNVLFDVCVKLSR